MNTFAEKINPSARRKARRFALQALYQWQITKQPISEIAVQYSKEQHMPKADVAYFEELLKEIPACHQTLDAQFTSALDRPLAELDPIELTVLRIATYELSKRIEIPYRVVINEAIELAKEFGAEDGYKYINGILDQVSKQLRQVEIR